LVVGEKVICTVCRYELPRTNYWLEKGNPVEQVFWGRVPIETACSFFHFQKGSRYRKLLHKLKYDNKPYIGVELGRSFGEALIQSPLYQDVTIIVPVPLHEKRLRQRGYNQSEQIAKGISEIIGASLRTDLLYRKSNTEMQLRKTREERHRNVRSAFAVNKDSIKEVTGQHILLVDDVLTTGATLDACGTTILKKCDCRVSMVTLAVAK
jgi:ComF family protein